jgi:tetratricopeptide (TPR) repeat protein
MMAMRPPSTPDPNLAKALDYHKAGQFERALKIYRRVLKQNPRHPDALILGGQAAFQAGHEQEGMRWLKKAVDAHPDNPNAAYNLGVMYQSLGDTHNALAAFSNAVQAGEGFAPSHYNLAMALHELGRSEEALPHFDRAAEAEPRYAEAHASKGYVLRSLGRAQEAISAYENAVHINPGDAKAWVGLGTCLQEVDRLDEALTAHRNALQANPDYPDAAMNVSDALVQAGRPDEAIRACVEYLRRHPGDSGVLATKSIALNEAGEAQKLAELVDLEHFVQPMHHDPPSGFRDMADFNRELIAHVMRHPTLVVAPASHTTMNGKQTGTLNIGVKGPIQALESLIGKAVERYIENVENFASHPVVAHRPQKYELSIWGTVLEGEGFQAPHIHPSGWLSGVFYPQVPSIVEEGQEKEGWIEFGQPGPEYHFTKPAPLRLVKPEPGAMVVFPSYMFHRTIAFQSDETRISIAFDVVPA